VAAFGVFMAAAILEHAWGADRLKTETIFAVLFALPFMYGIRRGAMEHGEYVVKRFVAVASTVVTIYAASGGMQGFVATQRMDLVGMEDTSTVEAGFALMAYRKIPRANVKNVRFNVKYQCREYQVELPRECGGGVRWLLEDRRNLRK